MQQCKISPIYCRKCSFILHENTKGLYNDKLLEDSMKDIVLSAFHYYSLKSNDVKAILKF